MKTSGLQRYERPACEACGVMAPECMVPVGDGAAAMCWLCAHDAVEHADGSKCGCNAAQIYPAEILAIRQQLHEMPWPARAYARDFSRGMGAKRVELLDGPHAGARMARAMRMSAIRQKVRLVTK